MQPSALIRITALALTLALANCATNPVTGNPNFVTVSESQEIQIGRTEDPKVRQEYGVYDNAALQQYVNEVGQKLARASHRPNLEYHFLVVDSPEVNAFALQMSGGLGDTALNLLGGALLSGYGREHELEADRLGSEYLARTGYDPQAMVRVVGVLKNQELFDAEVAKQEGREPRAYHAVFASHPDNDTRLQQVVGEAARFKQADTRTAREEYLRKIDRMVFADSPNQGVVRDNTLYHTGLGLVMRFPQGWRVKNQPQNITAASPGNNALIDLRMAGPAKGSPAEVLRKLVNLGFGAEVTPATVNGLPAAMTSTSIQGKPTRVAVVFLGKNAYAIGAQAQNSQTMNRYQPEIEASQKSFHAITGEERALARPLTLRMITARAGLAFAELARTSPLGKNAEGYLRVINGMYPAGEPVAGQALKIVQ